MEERGRITQSIKVHCEWRRGATLPKVLGFIASGEERQHNPKYLGSLRVEERGNIAQSVKVHYCQWKREAALPKVSRFIVSGGEGQHNP